MTPKEPEEMLWEMTREATDRDGRDAVSDADLLAYRSGELSQAEAVRIERSLEESRSTRRRLVELAGLDPHYAPESVRRAVLGGETNGGTSAGRSAWQLAAAALLAVALGAVTWLQVTRRADDRPVVDVASFAEAEFTVRVEGLAATRDGTAAETAVEAYPRTRLRFEIEAASESIGAFDAGVYAVRGGTLWRLEERIETEVHQGAVSIAAAAADLVGSEPGRYVLYVAVAPPGGLPGSPVEVVDDALAALVARGTRTYEQHIVLLAEGGESAI